MSNRHEEQSSNSNISGFLLGALTGALVGAGIALLFAPKAGYKLRHDLSRKYGRAASRIGDFADDAIERATDLADQAKAKVNDVSSRVAAATRS